jgi:hypothetical protein
MQLQWTQRRRRRTEEELAETETRDAAAKRAWEAAPKENCRPPPKKRKPLPPNEQVKGLQRFVEATEEAFGSNAAPTTSVFAFRSFVTVTNRLLALAQRCRTLDDAAARLYRDTTGRLGVLLSEERAVESLQVKLLFQVKGGLDRVLQLARTNAGVPESLSDTALQSTLLGDRWKRRQRVAGDAAVCGFIPEPKPARIAEEAPGRLH